MHLGALFASSLLNEIVLEVPWSVSRALLSEMCHMWMWREMDDDQKIIHINEH